MTTIETSSVRATNTYPLCDANPGEIADAQRALNTLAGCQVLAETGLLDPETTAAVRAFQREHGLPSSGCLDARTQTALLEAAAEHEATACTPAAYLA